MGGRGGKAGASWKARARKCSKRGTLAKAASHCLPKSAKEAQMRRAAGWEHQQPVAKPREPEATTRGPGANGTKVTGYRMPTWWDDVASVGESAREGGDPAREGGTTSAVCCRTVQARENQRSREGRHRASHAAQQAKRHTKKPSTPRRGRPGERPNAGEKARTSTVGSD